MKHYLPRTGPYYDDKFNILFAAFSARHVARYLAREVAACPSLKALGEETLTRLGKQLREMAAPLRSFILVVICAIIIFSASPHTRYFHGRYANIVATLLLLLTEVIAFYYTIRGRYEGRACHTFFYLITILERNPEYWRDNPFREHVARNIERAAREIERVPTSSYRHVSADIRNEIYGLAKKKAQAIRLLEWVPIKPSPSAYTDLISRFTDDIATLVDGRWYDLPEAEYKSHDPRWTKVVQVSGALLVIAGIIAAVIFSTRLGQVASVVVTLLATVALGLLNRAGLSITLADQYVEAASKIDPGRPSG